MITASLCAVGCDVVHDDEPKTIYGFWDDLTSSSDSYTSVTAERIVNYSARSGDDCFDSDTAAVTTASDVRVEAADTQTGEGRIAELDSTDADRMVYTVVAFSTGFQFNHERADGEDLTLREVERRVCEH